MWLDRTDTRARISILSVSEQSQRDELSGHQSHLPTYLRYTNREDQL